MRCFDCETRDHRTNEASVTCSVCGAGLCVDHAIEAYEQQDVHLSLGNPAVRRLPGRRMYCSTCVPDYVERAARSRAALAG
jgi:hypothetical protein